MKITVFKSSLVICLIVLFAACKKEAPTGTTSYKDPNLPIMPFEYKTTAQKLLNNKISVNDNAATLGRVLFYEKALSVNNLLSCGSCHVQSFAFSDGRQFSPGFEFLNTPRNSPAILNPGSMNRYFWDARAEEGLEKMVTMPIQNHLEMGIENLDYAVAKINAIPYYKKLFMNAYGSETATKQTFAKALTQFLASMVTSNSKFDEGERKQFSNFNEFEKLGKDLFFSSLHCSQCHTVSINNSWSSSDRFANIGLEMEYKDKGMYDPNSTTGRNAISYDGVFKTPSLRNIELTAPYMHDGRFKTLEEVIEHYNSGVVSHNSLDWTLTNATLAAINNMNQTNGNNRVVTPRPIIGASDAPARLSLSDTEKAALVAFLKTLTDNDFISHPMYSDPFKY